MYNIRPRQNGFSLIELMVAVLIGLFLTLGLSQIFLSMYSTSKSENVLSQYQSNQRQAIVALTNSVQLAGYYPATSTITTIGPNTSALPATTNSSPGDGSQFTAGAGIVGTTGSGTPEQDTLNIQYQSSGSDNVYNCQGGLVTSATTVIDSFSINAANNQLICTVTVAGTTTASLVLANNVHSMTILYGVDTTGGSTTPPPADTTNTYMNAKTVTADGYWLYVRSVQITLNFCTPNVISAGAPVAASTCNSPTSWVQTINLMVKS